MRAGLAQAMYARAKFGADRCNLRRILALCASANRFYPYNYSFCFWAAEQAFFASGSPQDREERALARAWCDRGLAMNPWNRELQILAARLTQRESPARAARQWERYVEWQFWDSYNHALLAELYADAGDIERAWDELEWVKGSRYYENTRTAIRAAWRRERQSIEGAGIAPTRLRR